MYHSITIKTLPSRGSGSLTFNTYKDWYLVPTGLPVIATPGIKTKIVDIPGANGALDLTESLTPYPLYENRTGSLEFALLQDRFEYYTRYNRAPHSVTSRFGKDDPRLWAIIYSDIANKLHGRKCQITLEDDPDWYYEGRISLNQWKSSTDGKWPLITFNYDLAPYKLSTYTSAEASTNRWLWNPFSFIYGVIPRSETINDEVYHGVDASLSNNGLWKGITVNSTSWVQYTTKKPTASSYSAINRDMSGWMPVSPTFTFSAANMGVRIINDELGYTYEKTWDTSGTKTDPECILYDYLGNGYNLYFKGTGTVDVTFRAGSL